MLTKCIMANLVIEAFGQKSIYKQLSWIIFLKDSLECNFEDLLLCIMNKDYLYNL